MATRLLLVDDDRIFGYALRRRLAQAGHATDYVESAYEALALVESDATLAGVILDIRMGRGQPHGFALARMVRARRGDLPIIYITAGDLVGVEGETALGPILQKSSTIDELIDAISSEIYGVHGSGPS